jgi:hypothetical protein
MQYGEEKKKEMKDIQFGKTNVSLTLFINEIIM